MGPFKTLLCTLWNPVGKKNYPKEFHRSRQQSHGKVFFPRKDGKGVQSTQDDQVYNTTTKPATVSMVTHRYK